MDSNLIKVTMPKVSVIIPIYGVERFIQRCVKSLMEQTLDDIEYIFVNDSTKDKSMDLLTTVLKKYPQRIKQIIIKNHSENHGLPAARNTGLAIASGEYIFHCDSDDFVESDMLEKLYKEAKRGDADIVWCDWYLTFAQNERYMKQPNYHTAEEALKGILCGSMKYNVWNKLIKRDLYINNNIVFPSGHGMGEDMTIIQLFTCANKVAYVDKAFYHYVKTNTQAFSQTYSERYLTDLKYNADRTISYIQDKYSYNLEKELAYFKLATKFPFLISNGKNGLYKLWKTWYPEANNYILSNKYISARSRIVQWCAWKNLYIFVWLHYVAISKFVYGILYK